MSTLSTPVAASRRTTLARISDLRAWLFLILLVVFFEIWAEVTYHSSFVLNPSNLQSISVFATAPLLLALGQTLVIISSGIDLSVGFTMGLAAVIAAHVSNLSMDALGLGEIPAMVLAIAAGIVVSLVPGLVNGWLIAHLRVPPFIGTLGMYGVTRGAAYLIAVGATVPIHNSAYTWVGNGKIGELPFIVLLTAIVVLATHYLLSQTRFGQHTYAIGANRDAAIRAGIDWRRHTIKLYLLSAICAGLAGTLYTGRFLAGAAQAGEPLLLDSIAAVVIGGASLFGGSGTVFGTIAGALVIAVIQYGLVFIDVEPFWQFVAVGVVIIISVLVDQSQRRLAGERQDG
ncbi:MAG: ribose ABC transporter [Methylobacteriaceae bacterium]|nr:ribose ABC transporter [Methylobacteriaceae bacterium]MBV9246783.1 ribose ABC transporter [Methylobacteriaceae bacterium]